MSVLETIDTTVTLEWGETRTIGTLVQLGGRTAVVDVARAPAVGTQVGLRIEGDTDDEAIAIDGVASAMRDGGWGEQQLTIEISRVGTTASAQSLRTFLEQHGMERGGSVSVGRHRDNQDVKRYVYVLPDLAPRTSGAPAGVVQAPTAISAPGAVAVSVLPPVAAAPVPTTAALTGTAAASATAAPSAVAAPAAIAAPGAVAAPAAIAAPGAVRAAMVQAANVAAAPAAAAAQPAPAAAVSGRGPAIALPPAAPAPVRAPIALGSGAPAALPAAAAAPVAPAPPSAIVAPATVSAIIAPALPPRPTAPAPAASPPRSPSVAEVLAAARPTVPAALSPFSASSAAPGRLSDAGLPLDDADEELSSTQMLDALSIGAAGAAPEPSFPAAIEDSVIDDELAALLQQLDERTSERAKQSEAMRQTGTQPAPTESLKAQAAAASQAASIDPEDDWRREPSVLLPADDPFASAVQATFEEAVQAVSRVESLPSEQALQSQGLDHDDTEAIVVETVGMDEQVAAPVLQPAEPGSDQDRKQKEVRSLVRRLFRRAESGAIHPAQVEALAGTPGALSGSMATPGSGPAQSIGVPAAQLFTPDTSLRVEIAVQFEWRKKKHSGTLVRLGESKVRLRSATMPGLYDRLTLLLPGNGPKDTLPIQIEVTHIRHPENDGVAPAFDARITPGGNPASTLAKLRDRLQKWATQTEAG